MKLLVYSHFFAPSMGGVETIVRSLASGLAEWRSAEDRPAFELTLVTETPRGEFRDASLPFRVVRQPSFAQLGRLIADSDVVHLAGPALLPMVLCWLAGKPFVVEHHGFQTICPNGQLLIEPSGSPCPGHFMAGRHGVCLRCNAGGGWFRSSKLWLLTFARRRLCRHAAANLTPTYWLSQLVELPRVTPLAHGLPPRAGGHSASPAGDTPVIVFQGRLVSTKGVHVLLEAVARLAQKDRRFELLIIGNGPERAPLERFTEQHELGARVRFCGSLPAQELESAFSRASLVVVPSLGGEVFGLVVVESMQRGLAVIASDLGAFVEVLGDAGLVFRTGDAKELGEALDLLLCDRARRTDLGRQARERVARQFSLEAMIEGHAAVYRRVER
jgi:glycosyltransferase involved in cell wall biosynthesis